MTLEALEQHNLFLRAQLHRIRKVAEDARHEHKVQGHQCELRSAIDSIADLASPPWIDTPEQFHPPVCVAWDATSVGHYFPKRHD